MKALECNDCLSAIAKKHPNLDIVELDEQFGEAECRCLRGIPCTICGEMAVFEGNPIGLYVCDKDECIIEAAHQNLFEGEISNEELDAEGKVYRTSADRW